jgi:hypothetical protein
MKMKTSVVMGLALSAAMGSALALAAQQSGPDPKMNYFVTSKSIGKGGNLGGLEGADRHCQALAAAAGAGNKTWRAYLSTQARPGKPAINARDRIGKGPWHNAKGVEVGKNPDAIHGINHPFNMDRIVTEEGSLIPNGSFEPNRHDILTGSTLDGKAYPAGQDMTCANWTSSTTGKARVGHHDRAQWNSAHDSQGCTQVQLRASGGDGLFYCFAAQ